MNHRELISELLKLSDEALKEIGRNGLAVNREVAERYVKGGEVEYHNTGFGWDDAKSPSFSPITKYRIKPCTININGHEVLEPVRNPKHDDRVFYYDGIKAQALFGGYDEERVSHINLRDKGLLFTTKEDCQKYADAIQSFTKEKP